MDIAVISALSALLGAFLVPLFQFIIAYVKNRGTQITEWSSQLNKRYDELIVSIQEKANKLDKTTQELQLMHTNCRVENEVLKGEIRLLQVHVNQLRVTNLAVLYRYPYATIVIDSECTIKYVDSGARSFLHMGDETIGKKIGETITTEIEEFCSRQFKISTVSKVATMLPKNFDYTDKNNEKFTCEILFFMLEISGEIIGGMIIRRNESVITGETL